MPVNLTILVVIYGWPNFPHPTQTYMKFNSLFKWSAERQGDNVDLALIGTTNLLLNKFVGVFHKFDNLDEVIKYLRFNH